MGLRAERGDRQAAERMNAMRSVIARGLAATLCSLVLVACAAADGPEPSPRSNPITKAVDKTKASIVCIRVPRPGGGKDMIGSGVIVDQRGIIVTNRHVVGSNRHVTVCLHDGSTFTGEVLAGDPARDLAVVRIDAKQKLAYLRFGYVKDLMVAETVIAIGHPYGYTNSVSTGIISALGREIEMPTRDVITGLIQHAAAINPGNSGGALLNINGELIGINVALREGAQNIAFAINAGDVEAFLGKHMSALKVSGVHLGLACEEKVIAEVGDRQRVVVTGGSTVAGFKSGDEIRAIGSLQIANAFDMERALWGKKVGEQVALTVVRQGQEMTVSLTLTAGQGAGQVAELGAVPAQQSANFATAGVPVSAPR
jgi:serine protease Do